MTVSALGILVTTLLLRRQLFPVMATRALYNPLWLSELMSMLWATNVLLFIPVTRLSGCLTLLKTPPRTLGVRAIDIGSLEVLMTLFGPSLEALLQIRIAATLPLRETILLISPLPFIQITLDTTNLALFPRQTIGLPTLQTAVAPPNLRILRRKIESTTPTTDRSSEVATD